MLGLTKRGEEILLHMTGLDRSAEQYRNHYAADEGGDAWKELQLLVGLGLLTPGVKREWAGGLYFFHATEAGIALAKELGARTGWALPLQSKKAHCFQRGRSLCGRWLYGGKLQRGNDDSPDNCAGCKRRLAAIRKEVSRDLE